MNDPLVFQLSPVLLDVGLFSVSYYDICFLVALASGFLVWRWQLLRGGYSRLQLRSSSWVAVGAIIAGARLGHVLFYAPGYYFSHPLQILLSGGAVSPVTGQHWLSPLRASRSRKGGTRAPSTCSNDW